MGKQVVAWRTEDGHARVADATCPHLGASLAPEWGGELKDNQLVCPFHGFRYGSDGACVGTPNGPLHKPLSLHTYPVDEIHGVILAYFDPERKAPEWHIPELDQSGWAPLVHESQVIKTHPQETTENGVDVAHLALVHSYHEVTGGRTLDIDGPLLQNRFNLSRYIGPTKWLGFRIDVQAVVSVWGLGYSMIEPNVPKAGADFRLLALCTPIDGEKIEFVMAMQSSYIQRPNALIPGLGLIPRRLLRWISLRAFFGVYKNDISQDFDIWENKKYLVTPRLGHMDGAIMQFRNYCTQFYPESDSSSPVVADAAPPNTDAESRFRTITTQQEVI